MSAQRIPTRRLPRQPNLEQLRKQAKELMSGWPGFTLSEAQRELARAYGFLSWPKLKAFVDGANVARLAEAVNTGDLSTVRKLLKARPELVSMDRAENDEHRALHYAVVRRDTAMVRLLMQAGADARKGIWPHRDATTALDFARDREFPEIVAVIEEEEQQRRQTASCPNAAVSPVQEQINEAIRAGDDESAIALLTADPALAGACDRNGATPLHAAAQAGSEEMVAWLLARGADPNHPDLHSLTPLDRAALAVPDDFPAVAHRLLGAGASLTLRGAVALGDIERARGLTPTVDARGGLLSLAVHHGQLEMIRLLLDLGADVDERTLLENVESPTESAGKPLWIAADIGRRDIAELLLDRGADPNANLYASGWPLDRAYRNHDSSMKQLLLSRGAKPQAWTIAGAHDVQAARQMLAEDPSEEVASELVWSAACNGCPEIVALALPRLDWPRADDRWHWILMQPPRSAGDNGIEEPYFLCMELLLAHGIDANVARRGATILHFTAARPGLPEQTRVRFAAMLLNRGARLDVRDDLLRSTPLAWACRWGRGPMVEFLLSRGASPNEPDAEAWATPLAWANKMGHPDIAALVRERA
ncbi:MAG TPA: ankyrin repeat domain-containing protein [Bryobacteraceae bacterium]|jgi:ankyrin repeat protein|nr:ankyrin repeat domain-containing protein [Bryobacteraceae bacterium]